MIGSRISHTNPNSSHQLIFPDQTPQKKIKKKYEEQMKNTHQQN